MGTKKISGEEITFLIYQTCPIHFIVMKLELLEVNNGLKDQNP